MGTLDKHIKCPCGQSSVTPAFAIYKEKGGYHCFSCDDKQIPKSFHKTVRDCNFDYEKAVEITLEKGQENVQEKEISAGDPHREYKLAKLLPITDRKISQKTATTYGVKTLIAGEHTKYFFPYFDIHKKGVAYKVKDPQRDIQYYSKGKMQQATLFGAQIFPDKKRWLVITEGEFDALAAHQMLDGRYPVVSLTNGALSLKRTCENNEQVYQYINSFEKIILCFDNDKAGQKAAKEVSAYFDYKPKVCRLEYPYKDACDYLKAGENKQFKFLIFDAKPVKPTNVIDMASKDFTNKVFSNEAINQPCYEYPFPTLTKVTYGMRLGEMTLITAETGVGKTSFVNETEHYTKMTHQQKIGMMHFEEMDTTVARRLTGIGVNCPIHLPDFKDKVSLKEQQKAYDRISKGMHLYADFGSKNLEDILNCVQYMVKAVSCKFIFLDHINMIVSDQRHEDERKALDEIVTKLKTKTTEWGFHLALVAHVNRQGLVRSTANIEKLANVWIHLDRNILAEDETERNTTNFIVRKNRFSGTTGPAGKALYHPETGRMREIMKIETPDGEESKFAVKEKEHATQS